MIGNTGTALSAFQRLLLPRDDTVTVRCPACGHTEARAVEQAGIRCPVCGACVSVIPDRGRHLPSDRVEVSRYWGHGWLDRRGARGGGPDDDENGGSGEGVFV